MVAISLNLPDGFFAVLRDPSPPQGQGPHSSVLPVSKYRRPLGTMCGKWVLSPWPRAERKLPGGRRRVDEVRVDAYKRPSQKSKFTLRTKAGWDLAAGFQVEFSTIPPAGYVTTKSPGKTCINLTTEPPRARCGRRPAYPPARRREPSQAVRPRGEQGHNGQAKPERRGPRP